MAFGSVQNMIGRAHHFFPTIHSRFVVGPCTSITFEAVFSSPTERIEPAFGKRHFLWPAMLLYAGRVHRDVVRGVVRDILHPCAFVCNNCSLATYHASVPNFERVRASL